MKAVIGFGAAALLIGLGIYLASPGKVPPSLKPLPKPAADPPTSVLNDPVEIFQKAFWRRPTAGDKILHAERREWADVDGVKKWQWFIIVEPSPGLVKYLREDNAFSLAAAASVPVIKNSPTWFAIDYGDTEILQAPNGSMCLFFSKSKQLLHATDSGGGFHAGAPESAKPVATSPEVKGRLPLTLPPKK